MKTESGVQLEQPAQAAAPATPNLIARTKTHKAFISYSQAADERLAPTLQATLHRFAKPFYRRRALRIFRDKTSLHLTPELWPLIQRALADSEFFILLASPDAAGSRWVQAEVDEWLRLSDGSLAKLLLVLTDGELVWDSATSDFDWGRTTALPPNLGAKFEFEPLHLDLRWAKQASELSLQHPRFFDDIGALAAVLHGKPKDEMIGQDVKQHRLFRLVVTLVVIALVALTIAAFGAAYYANQQRNRAEWQRNQAVARQLAAQSLLLPQNSDQRSTLSFLLALESLRRFPTNEGAQALRRSASLTRDFEHDSRIKALVVSPDSHELLVATEDGKLSAWAPPRWVWDELESPSPRKTSVLTAKSLNKLTLSLDGKLAAVTGQDDVTLIVDTTGQHISTSRGLEALAFSGDGKNIATADRGKNTIDVWDPRTGRLAGPPCHQQAVQVMLSFDGKLLAACGSDLQVSSVADGKELYRRPQAAIAEAIAFSPNGKYLATAEGYNSWVGDARTGATVDTIIIGYPVHSLVFSSNSQLLAVGYEGGAGVWNLQNRRMDAAVEHTTNTGMMTVAFSSDNQWLFTGADDSHGKGIIKSWLLPPTEVLRAAEEYRKSVMSKRTFSAQEWRQYFGEEPQPSAEAL